MTRIDPVCGMTGVLERCGQWFCSDHCAEEYARRPRQATAPEGVGAACHVQPQHRLTDPWVWVPLTGVAMVFLGQIVPAAFEISESYIEYLRKVCLAFLLGLFLGGFIDHFVPKEYIVKLLSGPRKRVIARSIVLGLLASTCSHGVLALTIELYRKGASVPAVVSFLLASPWASMSLTLLLLSLFGLKGMVLVAGALAIAFITGLIFQQLARRHLIDENPQSLPIAGNFSIRRDFAERWHGYPWTPHQLLEDARGIWRGMVPLGRMILGWVQLGLVLSAIFGSLVPHTFIERFLGPTGSGLLLTLAFATVLEVCSEGTAPLAYEMFRHTGALGNAFAFLMGGVVTDYTELIVVWRAVGRRTVLWLLAVTLPLVLVTGWVLNLLS